MTIGDLELALRLVLALVLSGAIGLEREARGQVAGLRTHILVGVGSALFTLVSAYGFEPFAAQVAAQSAGTRADPTRIAAQIVTGIGFLGAGAIIRQGASVRGLTTAAGLWMSAAIGMAVGIGYYAGAVITTIIALVALVGLRHLGPRLRAFGPRTAKLDVHLRPGASVSSAVETLEDLGATVAGLTATGDGGAYRLSVRLSDELDGRDLVHHLERLEDVESVVERRG